MRVKCTQSGVGELGRTFGMRYSGKRLFTKFAIIEAVLIDRLFNDFFFPTPDRRRQYKTYTWDMREKTPAQPARLLILIGRCRPPTGADPARPDAPA
ncbi:hypothetical protein EVAR_63460_1 [Eumeta japonica]|uniref:Uncharacterized protein n=1 Tax=Eumeta variegata TaxID=151549 RepID=A0A4C1YE22_EUMVA|nr:hypothetical protein EVAR_63460_1 [Eumeta japonica]